CSSDLQRNPGQIARQSHCQGQEPECGAEAGYRPEHGVMSLQRPVKIAHDHNARPWAKRMADHEDSRAPKIRVVRAQLFRNEPVDGLDQMAFQHGSCPALFARVSIYATAAMASDCSGTVDRYRSYSTCAASTATRSRAAS